MLITALIFVQIIQVYITDAWMSYLWRLCMNTKLTLYSRHLDEPLTYRYFLQIISLPMRCGDGFGWCLLYDSAKNYYHSVAFNTLCCIVLCKRNTYNVELNLFALFQPYFVPAIANSIRIHLTLKLFKFAKYL